MKPSFCVPPLLLLLPILLIASSSCEGAITCSEVIEYLRPCEAYLTGSESGTRPPASCCKGANALKHAASKPEDRRTACVCIKAVAQTIKLNPQNAHDLPSNCGIILPFDISPNLDCTKIG